MHNEISNYLYILSSFCSSAKVVVAGIHKNANEETKTYKKLLQYVIKNQFNGLKSVAQLEDNIRIYISTLLLISNSYLMSLVMKKQRNK